MSLSDRLSNVGRWITLASFAVGAPFYASDAVAQPGQDLLASARKRPTIERPKPTSRRDMLLGTTVMDGPSLSADSPSNVSDLTEFSSDPDVREQQIADLLRTHMPGDLELEYQEPEAYKFEVDRDRLEIHFPNLVNYRNHQELGVTHKISDARTLALTVDAYNRIQEGYPELFYFIAESVREIQGNDGVKNSSNDSGLLHLDISVRDRLKHAQDAYVGALIEEAVHIGDSERISWMVGKRMYGDKDWIHHSPTESQTAGPDGEARVRAFTWYAAERLSLSSDELTFLTGIYRDEANVAGLPLEGPSTYFKTFEINPDRFLLEGHEGFRRFYETTRPPRVEIASEGASPVSYVPSAGSGYDATASR